MNKFLKRFLAYIIDMLIVLVLTTSLAGTTIFNPNLNKYQKYSKEYAEKYKEVAEFIEDIQKKYNDNKLTEKEYNKLKEKYPTYEIYLNKYYKENKLTKKNYSKLLNKLSNDFLDNTSDLRYKMEKYSVYEIIIRIVLTILYFVGFNYITDGQTLGKKLLHLRIVDKDNNKNKVSLLSYTLRAVLMYEIIYDLSKIISIYSLNQKDYFNVTNAFLNIQNIIQFLIIAFIIIRNDGRGIHDIIAKTRVEMYNKKGKVIE